MKRLVPLIGIFFCLTLAFGQSTDDPAGTWYGSISLPAINMDVSVTLARMDDGTWDGTIDIPAQGAKDLQLINIQADKDKVVFEIAKVPGDPTFSGKLSQDGKRISGDFTQGSTKFPFSLTRSGNRN